MLRWPYFLSSLLGGLLACSPKTYTYQVNVATVSQPSELQAIGAVSLETVDLRDTTFARVTCVVVDLPAREPMGNTVVMFTKSEARTVLAGITDETGLFDKKIPPGHYDVEVRYTGKNTFRRDTLSIAGGMHYHLDIGLGNSGASNVKTVTSRRPLTPDEIEKLKNR